MTPAFLTEVGCTQLYTAAQDMMKLWRLKMRMAGEYSFPVADDINHMSLDAIWALTFGTAIGTTQFQVECLSSMSNLGLPQTMDSPVDFPTTTCPAAFESIITLTSSMEVGNQFLKS